MEFEDCIFSYNDIKNRTPIGNDPEGIGSYALLKGVQNTLLSNPSLEDNSEPMLMVSKIDGDIAGRILFFPSRVSINGKIEKTLEGSSLFVSERGRKYSLGVGLMTFPIVNGNNNYLLYAGISKMALPIYRKMKFSIFETPTKWQVRNSTPVLQSLGFKGGLLIVAKLLINAFLSTFIWASKAICHYSSRKYKVVRLEEVPQWVVDITMSEDKKYFEVHDKRWFDWVLTNNFFQSPKDKQELFGIYSEDEPAGFILIKERELSILEKNINSVVFGSVVEWGIKENISLDEYKLNKIAVNLFSVNTDILQISSDNELCLKKLSKYGFLSHGSINVAFKDLTGKLSKDISLKKNWRLRPGYSDVPFY